MIDLLISEITHMGEFFCAIGLEEKGGNCRSVRPVPAGKRVWPEFPFFRGNVPSFGEGPKTVAVPPHIEDYMVFGYHRERSLPEPELLSRVKRAEVAGCLKELFSCGVRPSPGAAARRA